MYHTMQLQCRQYILQYLVAQRGRELYVGATGQSESGVKNVGSRTHATNAGTHLAHVHAVHSADGPLKHSFRHLSRPHSTLSP